MRQHPRMHRIVVRRQVGGSGCPSYSTAVGVRPVRIAAWWAAAWWVQNATGARTAPTDPAPIGVGAGMSAASRSSQRTLHAWKAPAHTAYRLKNGESLRLFALSFARRIGVPAATDAWHGAVTV